jgi:hypothetical protein
MQGTAHQPLIYTKASTMKNYASSYNAQMSQYGQALRMVAGL